MRQALAILSILFMCVMLAAAYAFSRPQEMALPSKDPIVMLQLTSPSFQEGGVVPPQFTCDGANIHPELRIEGVPEGTQSLVVLMDDPDIPPFVKERMGIDVFEHWVLFNIDPHTSLIEEGMVPNGAIQGSHSGGRAAYTGPCPPDREHRYFWKLYALDTLLDLQEGATKAEVESAMAGHTIGSTTIISRYQRQGH